MERTLVAGLTRCYCTAVDPAVLHKHTVLQAGPSPLQIGPKAEDKSKKLADPLMFLLRLLLGTLAGFYFFLVPAYMWIKHKIWPRNLGGF
jgi:hypothetical protein